jgi:hypothetical protein
LVPFSEIFFLILCYNLLRKRAKQLELLNP